MTTIVKFRVYGIPKPGGSKRAFPIRKKDGSIVKIGVVDASKDVKDWKNAVVDACKKVFPGNPKTKPLKLSIEFLMPYRKSDFDKKGDLKGNAPIWHNKKPDITKLLRSTEDALNGVLWHDDSQIVEVKAKKYYNLTPGAEIIAYFLEG